MSEQIQGVGQGARLDTARLELALPFMVGLGALSPAPTPEPPPEKSLGGPRPAGLLHPGSAAPQTTPLPLTACPKFDQDSEHPGGAKWTKLDVTDCTVEMSNWAAHPFLAYIIPFMVILFSGNVKVMNH